MVALESTGHLILQTETGWRDPGENEAQRRYLHSFRPRNYYIAGRGSGKTAVACVKGFLAAAMSPGVTGYITEQTSRDIIDILIPAWQSVVPCGAYKLVNTVAGWEARLPNGAVIRFRSRQAKNTISDPPFRGPTAGFLIHDEIALDTRDDVPQISEMMLRDHHSKFLFADYITTPKTTGWFYGHVLSQGIAEPGERIQIAADNKAAAFYGSTKDNQYNRNLYGRMIDKLSETEAQQELEGWFVSRDGLCWSQFSNDDYPDGNMVDDGGFKAGQPYILSVDHGGANGCWLLLQARGQGQYSLVAEYTYEGKPAREIVPAIKKQYGNPGRIFSGADHVTRGNTGDSAQHLFISHGWDNVERITGDMASKEMQGNVLAGLLCNTAGERKLLISKQLESHGPGPTRGVVDLLQHDTWPGAGGKDYFRKEKSKGIMHEDSRDALLYWAIGMFPPVWGEYTKWAA